MVLSSKFLMKRLNMALNLIKKFMTRLFVNMLEKWGIGDKEMRSYIECAADRVGNSLYKLVGGGLSTASANWERKRLGDNIGRLIGYPALRIMRNEMMKK